MFVCVHPSVVDSGRIAGRGIAGPRRASPRSGACPLAGASPHENHSLLRPTPPRLSLSYVSERPGPAVLVSPLSLPHLFTPRRPGPLYIRLLPMITCCHTCSLRLLIAVACNLLSACLAPHHAFPASPLASLSRRTSSLS
jgi:hypothetical protein